METVKNKKRGPAAIFSICPGRNSLLLLSAALIALHLVTRGNAALMERISTAAVRPVHHFLARVTGRLPFSLAELLIALAVVFVTLYIAYCLCLVIKGEGRGETLYRLVVTPLSVVTAVYALFCLLWGSFFYGDDFAGRAGLDSSPVKTEELAAVTEYFAALANEYSPRVARDDYGFCATDRAAVLESSPHIFDAVEKLYPCLDGPDVKVKPVFFSRIMSYLDFTGFFFPITGEANVNMDFPPSLFASTVAHEISHQRGVAKEQEANFVAVLACLESGDADYIYSAALLAYTHLGNALYSADYAAWLEIYHSLNDDVLRDFAANRAYWQRFETTVQAVSNTVYEGFLHSYDQHLGLKSYGACVDLLVNYYYDIAENS